MELYLQQAELLYHKAVIPGLIISALIFFHELGHFLLAKWCGVGVVKFSVGFGPALLRFRYGETIYQLSIIPLGGFVRMVGELPDFVTGGQPLDDGESDEKKVVEELSPELRRMTADRSRWFMEKSLWQRCAIVFAGPFFNFVLAFFIIFLSVMLYGLEYPDESSTIGRISSEHAPAYEAGLRAGDKVVQINGKEIGSWVDVAKTIHGGGGEPIAMQVERDGQPLDLTITPERQEIQLPGGTKHETFLIGIEPNRLRSEHGPLESAWYAGTWVVDRTLLVYEGILGMIAGKVSPDDLAGPLFIIGAVGKESQKGLERLLLFTAFLSLSLAALNLLPIPVLDGGYLLFFLIEAVVGPISMRKKEFAQSVGLLLLLGLMVFAIRNDVKRDPDALNTEVKWEKNEEGAEDSADTTKQNEQAADGEPAPAP